ncbi:SH3 domain-containing protein [Lactobacillus sp. LC28-10]|uniref:SH3 domain-containing protein n=1 Tax=Secundilactobacillus angelensis TaxID=2722706 RepID=A0ABX1KWH9_9LACO|nr:N-acetylmuramoyl-L-alanine amidase [Secundilactobacillus angelensis]MCH5461284.1 N-acetylmuramoyl-L-alanine amidase [Secundilactobacillus angelensis]NLR17520.1 SH3 domain-containing protein [Secundilactobacillus angelensis]
MNYLKQHWQQIAISFAVLLTLGIAVFQTVRQDRLTTPIANINVRTGPNINYQTKAILKKGQAVYIVQKKNNWYKVRYDDHQFGWVASWLINQSGKIQTATNLSEATIVLDPGHGGSDSGALSIDQHHDEKTYTLQLAKKVRAQLTARGAHVIMTRTGDQTVSLGARPEMATDNHADAFISFHYDSSPSNNLGSGFTTYYYHANTSLKLAHTINQHLTGLPLENKGVEVGNFEVIRDNLRPALLLEMGYINTAKDFKEIENPAYQNQVAKDVTNGLAAYFNNK